VLGSGAINPFPLKSIEKEPELGAGKLNPVTIPAEELGLTGGKKRNEIDGEKDPHGGGGAQSRALPLNSNSKDRGTVSQKKSHFS